MKVMTVVGARPQFVKAAIVSRAFSIHRSDVKELIVHTGQHYDFNMSDVFFEQLKIPEVTVNLNIGGGSHGANTGRMLEAIEQQMLKHRPDWVLTYGDTDSTLAGALAAVKLNIPCAHVEAGLRSFNRGMPEEINRELTDKISSALFCPTQRAVENLIEEGITAKRGQKVIYSGDVMYDASLLFKSQMQKPATRSPIPETFILCTFHRADNTDNISRLTDIVVALKEIAEDIDIVLPLHPRTLNALQNCGLDLKHSRIHLLQPQPYLALLWLLNHANVVLTDSGGLQKEAYFFGKPCIILRDQTEWVELLSTGMSFLVGARRGVIIDETRRIMAKHSTPEIQQGNLYGNGNAARQIVTALN